MADQEGHEHMDANQFDTITKELTTAPSRRQVVGALFGGMAAALGGAHALEAKKGGNGKAKHKGHGKKKPKAPICPQGQTITVGQPAVSAHLPHGDPVGACVSPPPPPPPAPTCTDRIKNGTETD